MALGVRKRWYIPLVLCRALSTSSAVAWAITTGLQLFYAAGNAGEYDIITGELTAGRAERFGGCVEHYRLAVVQVGLSYLWVSLFHRHCDHEHLPLRRQCVGQSHKCHYDLSHH